ncbi:MAG: hypothetical protein ACI4PW_04935, partial [Alphaproteobacteria bacterium]
SKNQHLLASLPARFIGITASFYGRKNLQMTTSILLSFSSAETIAMSLGSARTNIYSHLFRHVSSGLRV